MDQVIGSHLPVSANFLRPKFSNRFPQSVYVDFTSKASLMQHESNPRCAQIQDSAPRFDLIQLGPDVAMPQLSLSARPAPRAGLFPDRLPVYQVRRGSSRPTCGRHPSQDRQQSRHRLAPPPSRVHGRGLGFEHNTIPGRDARTQLRSRRLPRWRGSDRCRASPGTHDIHMRTG